MSTTTTTSGSLREPELQGQTIVVIGGSAGIGFETARRARAEGGKTVANELRAMLLIRRVVEATDVAALAVHIMTNTALTGATYDVDGGQQLLAG